MGTLGIINSDRKVRESVEYSFKYRLDLTKSNDNKDLIFLAEEDEILEFLKYSLPELVVINFSDKNIKIDKIIDQIRNDRFVLNFGIIGIFDTALDMEEDLLKKYKSINVLALLDSRWIKTHLVKSVEIIEQNYQIIFQREFTKTFLEGAGGRFILDNDIRFVHLYSGIGATILAQRGLINPDSKMHLQLALSELIINAIEHGNCGISYEEKEKVMESGLSFMDLVAEKCEDPAIKAKKVLFSWEIKNDRSVFIVHDQGAGFDVYAFLDKLKKQSDYSLHGRGIKMAAMLAHKIRYNSKGNKAALVVKHDASVEHYVPAGFIKEQVIQINKGDVVLREGERSDCLYYISAGTFEVLHNDKCVGTLCAQDIFLGEMSFLLDQRRSATIRATSAGKLILLTQKNFINIIREYPHYGIFLSKLLAKRLVRSNDQAAGLQ